ncbi:sensor domain-containing diguanylate cyclase (plasmid) [Paracoccus liaowanqingii]|uniref:diguanylate cyclase n=1 Tax=Paracoccus liaowanqingii TaxID=2560053 RepID=A0A4Y5SS92_9RHOB|nr:sensor domain-containing diguanylate cyclase [Paracoccus liaowanqingii]QDA36189.1 sensor domain-containing diguanylate cyclase [Paracoccus liaowanqingii]
MTDTFRFKADDEPGRLAALHRYGILDSAPEKEFNDIVALVKSIFSIQYAAVSLIDVDRQWIKAAAGIEPQQCAREDSFCTYTIRSSRPLSVESTSTDPRFMHNPFVTGEAHIRSYLGAPLMTPDGYNIGALCVFGTEPRLFTDGDKEILMNFAKVVVSQIELRLAANRDSLTGAMTRRNFENQMDDIFSANLPASLILLDIDHFKSINDTFGHPAGDLALKEVVACLTKCIRRGDCIGRLGGEEFGILLPQATGDTAMIMADRLRTTVMEEPLAALDHRPITISLGVAERESGEVAEDWIKRADLALYQAKQTGRNKAVQMLGLVAAM